LRVPSLRARSCSTFNATQLRHVLERMHVSSDQDLLSIYRQANDPRAQSSASISELRSEWATVDSHAERDPSTLRPVVRDGLCHTAVMWFVHHLAAPARHSFAVDPTFELPLLPPHIHANPESKTWDDSRAAVFEVYNKQVSCQQCHSGAEDEDAALPLPSPPDRERPGLERLRSCDFQYSPSCGPCEGLGGPRTGDGNHEFDPVPCEVVSFPGDVNASERVPAAYPMKATAHMVGEVRVPLVLIPDGHGDYPAEDINVSFGWDGQVARMRYSFNKPERFKGSTQTYLQTFEQISSGSTGATISVSNSGTCTCDKSVAGVLHIRAFLPHDKLDIIDLPASQGGLEYLGRVRLNPLDDGIGKRVVVADHYLKYGFHILVDAEKGSPTYGLPLRTYIPWGVRQVFTGWDLKDPAASDSTIWDIPKGCTLNDASCDAFVKQSELVTLI